MTVDEVVRILGRERHPREDGWFKETYRSGQRIKPEQTSGRYDSDRAFSTQIFYLITPANSSKFHRVKSDEFFHFYMGESATLCLVSPDGEMQKVRLGHDIANNEQLQCLVPADYWQALYMEPHQSWTLLGATVSPGFEYADFDEPSRDQMMKLVPDHPELMKNLTHD